MMRQLRQLSLFIFLILSTLFISGCEILTYSPHKPVQQTVDVSKLTPEQYAAYLQQQQLQQQQMALGMMMLMGSWNMNQPATTYTTTNCWPIGGMLSCSSF